MSGQRKSLLESPTHEAVRRIAGSHLAAAAKGSSRFQDTEDPKALHAFRVAVRRLRSLLRAYKPWIGRVARGKVRRGLRELTRDTNAARDAEVQLAWLAAQHEMLARNERAGHGWLARRLRLSKRRASRTAGARMADDLADVARRIRDRLEEGPEGEPVPYRSVTAGLVETGTAKLRARVAAIEGPDDEEGVHRSRVQVKRLRYLIEPLRRELPAARDAVRALRDLQDLLGALHDRHVLEDALARYVEDAATERARRTHALAIGGRSKLLAREQRRDEGVGLVALAALARRERDAQFARLQRNWLGRAARLLEREMDDLLRALAPSS